MPAKIRAVPRRIYVVPCPSCKKPVDFTGDGGVYFTTKKKALSAANDWLGTAGETLTGICGCSWWAKRKKVKL